MTLAFQGLPRLQLLQMPARAFCETKLPYFSLRLQTNMCMWYWGYSMLVWRTFFRWQSLRWLDWSFGVWVFHWDFFFVYARLLTGRAKKTSANLVSSSKASSRLSGGGTLSLKGLTLQQWLWLPTHLWRQMIGQNSCFSRSSQLFSSISQLCAGLLQMIKLNYWTFLTLFCWRCVSFALALWLLWFCSILQPKQQKPCRWRFWLSWWSVFSYFAVHAASQVLRKWSLSWEQDTDSSSMESCLELNVLMFFQSFSDARKTNSETCQNACAFVQGEIHVIVTFLWGGRQWTIFAGSRVSTRRNAPSPVQDVQGSSRLGHFGVCFAWFSCQV